jgi:glucose-1-phosphate thymidylyltransferase
MQINLVIPAAGAATRLRPLSSYTSKAMVRVNGKPCIDYILEQALKLAEIKQVVVVDGKYDDIRDYCEVRWPAIKFVKQFDLNGPHDAIRIGINSLDDLSLPLVVWLGDAIILENNMKLGTDFLLCKEVEDHHNWCMWNGKNFYDKPAHTIPGGVALVGLYSFSNGRYAKSAFERTDQSYEISDALEEYDKDCNIFRSVMTDKWYDIGELQTYYKTCAELLNLKARAFHSMDYDPELGVIRKRPDFHDKHSIQTIHNEKQWYAALAPEQQMFVPRILPHKTDLIMSYESGTLLSDLMMYEQLRESTWEYIIDKVFRIKLKYFNRPSETKEFVDMFDEASHDIWITKTVDRLDKTSLLTDHQKQRLVLNAERIKKRTRPIEGMHGDLHFGNILYNQQTDQMKFIDPRGLYEGWSGTYGDDLYDFAKLAHDLYHGYNALVANVPHNEDVKRIFVKMLKKYNLPEKEIIDGGLLLIATCIPLHYEDSNRQKRFAKYVGSQL